MNVIKKFFSKKAKLPNRSIDDIKKITNIVFIDDQKFGVIDIIKSNFGWKNVKRVKDIESLDDDDIKKSHILFIDINGVGKKMGFKDGQDLTIAIKERFPNKKVIIYSADSFGDRFNSGLHMADDRLNKSATPYEFQKIIEENSKETFSLNECLFRIQKMLYEELGETIDSEQIAKKINKIYKNKTYNVQDVAKIFDIENALLLTNILKAFLSPDSSNDL